MCATIPSLGSMGGGGIKAQYVCQLVLLGVRRGLGFGGGDVSMVDESATAVPLPTGAASAPWRPSNTEVGVLHTRISQDGAISGMLSTTDLGNVAKGQGVADHQV